jgi:hypothetical protein
MTEKQDVAEKAESLFDRILHRLISVIPYLLLSAVIAFLLFKYLYEKFGSNFWTARILGIIIMGGIAFLISTTVGRICKDRQFGCSLAFLIPVTISMEAAIQFGQPAADVITITFLFGMIFGGYNYFIVHYMLSPRVNVEKIKEDKVVCIRIFSPIVDVERLIEDVLSYLNSTFYRHKTKISDKEIQWVLGSGHYYLSARSHDVSSVELAFLFFTEGDKELYQSEQNKKDLKFIKGTIEWHLRSDNREYQSIPSSPLSSGILKRALRKYERATRVEKLKDAEKMLINNLKSYKYVIIIVFSIAFMVYLWRQSISQLYEQNPPLFLAMISIISVLLGVFAKDILQFLKIGNKK